MVTMPGWTTVTHRSKPRSLRDERSANQRRRALRDPLGDFESVGAHVIAHVTGSDVTLQDDNSRDGLTDLRIEHLDGRVAYGEVTTAIDEDFAALADRLREGKAVITVDDLAWWWGLSISPEGSLDRRWGDIIQCLRQMEGSGEEYALMLATDAADAGARCKKTAKTGGHGSHLRS